MPYYDYTNYNDDYSRQFDDDYSGQFDDRQPPPFQEQQGFFGGGSFQQGFRQGYRQGYRDGRRSCQNFGFPGFGPGRPF